MMTNRETEDEYNVEVITPPNQMFSSWIGGSKLASNPKNINWITNKNSI